MGCDIHLFREKRENGKWLTAEQWAIEEGWLSVQRETRAWTGRSYALFGALAKGAREDVEWGFVPRGLPLNPSAETARCYEQWESDAHSANHLYLGELRELSLSLPRLMFQVSGMMQAEQWQSLKAGIDAETANWHKLYPYCKYTNAPDHVDFEARVPATFLIGAHIDALIASFGTEVAEGDNHRIVFWFDN